MKSSEGQKDKRDTQTKDAGEATASTMNVGEQTGLEIPLSTPHNEESETPKPSPDSLMKQYQMMVDVYKFHFEISLKFIIFYYAITGAILSYYLSEPNTGFMYYALVLPIFMGFVFSAFAFLGALEVDSIKKHIVVVADGLHLKAFPDERLLERLKLMLMLTSALFFGTAICLLWVTCNR
jgi:hypothetical protein